MIPSFKREFVTVNGLRLAVSSIAASEKPALLCLHGGPGLGSDSIEAGLVPLADAFEMTFLDLRGNGRSQNDPSGDYSINAYSSDVQTFLRERFSGRQVGLLGHSFGGTVALKVLSEAPALFSFGILCGAPCDTSWAKDAAEAVASLRDPTVDVLEERILTESNPSDTLYRDLMVALAPIYFSELPPDHARRIMSPWSYRVAPYRYAGQKIFSSMDLKADARLIRVPVLAIGGGSDQVIRWTQVEHLASLIEGADIMRIDEAGHFPFLTKTDAFKKAVSGWVEKQFKKGAVK